ncbi:MAG TPA: AbfB domain-containing protein [Acetivibrio clariflavus]|nr:AbfB domain-containing protein [Acetivibrio clariflavus]
MKYEGIVIKLSKNRAIVTTDDFQCFYIKRTPAIYVGKQVEFTRKDIVRRGYFAIKLISTAACILLVLAAAFRLLGIVNDSGIISGSKTFAYIGIDINPSLDIEIDEKGLVLGLIPLNEDAKVLIKNFSAGKVEVSKVVNDLIGAAKSNGIVSETENDYVLVSSTLNNDNGENNEKYQTDRKKLDSIVSSLKNSVEKDGKISIYIVQADKSERKDAQEMGISTGRYKLFTELKDSIKDFSIEEAKSIGVKELIELKINQKEDYNIVTTPVPATPIYKAEDTENNTTPVPSDEVSTQEVSNEAIYQIPTISLIPTQTPTPMVTPKPTIIPTPNKTPKSIPTSTPASAVPSYPIIMPIPMPTMPFMSPIMPPMQSSNSVYMKFEAYNYPGQFIQHKIHFDAYISANGILPEDCVFKIVPGLADQDCISFESKNFPGFYLKNENFKIVLKPFDGSKDFKENATFKKVPGLADENLTSFQSYKYPDRYIRHKHFIIQVDEITSDDDKKDATFKEIEVK